MTQPKEIPERENLARKGDSSLSTPPGSVDPAGRAFSGEKLKVLDLFSGYTIREDGVVTSRFGRQIKHQVGKNGYVRVELWSKGKGQKYLIHRLLAQSFIPNPEGKPQVNHIDGNPQNNNLTNLEWVTQSENQLHAYRTGLQVGYKKPAPLSATHKKALCGSRWRGERRIYWAEGQKFKTPEEAARSFGVNRQTVYNRAKSPNFPDWKIEVRREVKNNA